jgi:hypothetical protein
VVVVVIVVVAIVVIRVFSIFKRLAVGQDQKKFKKKKTEGSTEKSANEKKKTKFHTAHHRSLAICDLNLFFRKHDQNELFLGLMIKIS